MTREMLFERLKAIFGELFDDDSITVTETTTAADIEGWDSFQHIHLILAIESCFGMKFTIGEVTGMKNVGEMADIIAVKATKQ